ncbi:uncharacterized protein LOC124145770 [Haliotis rufescens]|uniref:uncharacterized protein LOC124145770 n=1 Tax=Haliotis rufescens TaxID=6454 RepID=UPI00201F751B|nr:uncharacterized protein LOC124145770 [Haliotis rufescens]
MVQHVCVMCRLMAEVKIMPVVESLNEFGCLSEDFYQDLKKTSVSKRIKWRGLLRKINSNQQKLARMIFVQLIQRVNPEIGDELEKVSQICCVCGLIDNLTADKSQDDQIKFMSLQFPKSTHTWEPLRRSKSLDILIQYSCSSLEDKPSKPADKPQSDTYQDHGTGYIRAVYNRSGLGDEDSHGEQSTHLTECHSETVIPCGDSFSTDETVDSDETPPVEVQNYAPFNEDSQSDADADFEESASYIDAPGRFYKSDFADHTSEGTATANIDQPSASVDVEDFALEKATKTRGKIIYEDAKEVGHNPVEQVCGPDEGEMLAFEDLVPQVTSMVPTKHVGRHATKTTPVLSQTMPHIPVTPLVWILQVLLVLTVVVVVIHVLPTGLLLSIIALICIHFFRSRNG